jgi:DNA-binding NarL/FixJ family response regulator
MMPLEHVLTEAGLVDGTRALPRNGTKSVESPTAKSLKLTSAQFEVLQLFVRGQRVSEVAAQLGLAVSSIHQRKTRLMDRLRVTNDAELIAWAIEHGVR